jgi:hypothetical protein
MKIQLASCVSFLVLAMLVSTTGMAQEEPQSIRLTIALSKKSYLVGEPVIVTYKLTNLSNSQACFPAPAIDCYSLWGELAADATPPKGVTGPKHNGGCAADRFGAANWMSDIDDHWLKLGRLQSYEITKESQSIGLTAPGQWTVEAGYVPMNTDGLPELRKALTDRGCRSVPALHSTKLIVTVKENNVK